MTIGQSKSESTGTQQSAVHSGSSVQAGRDLIIAATGADQASNLNLIGSNVQAGRDLTLMADNQVNLLGALDSNSEHAKNSGSGWGIGVAASIGASGIGFGITANASVTKGHIDGEDRTWQNSHVNAGETLNIVSGGDTNLRGAVANAKQVIADIGGDLNLASLQDTRQYDSKQMTAGGSVTVGVGVSGSVNVSQEQMRNDYASVVEQSGIVAGDGGFQLKVKGNTDLTGAVIASSADADKNSLSTGSLSVRDLENHAEYSGSSMGLGLSGSLADKSSGPQGPGGKVGLMDFGDKNQLNATLPVVLGAGSSETSTTHSAISAGSIVITDAAQQQEKTGQTAAEAVAGVSRDTGNAHQALNDEFDAKEIHSGFVVTQAFVQEVGTFRAAKAQEADAAKKAYEAAVAAGADETTLTRLEGEMTATAKWGPGGEYGRILGAVVAGVSGNVTGGIGQAVQSAAVNYVQGLAAEQVKYLADELKSETACAALQGIVACAGASLSQGSCSSAALGAASAVVLNNLLGGDPDKMTAQEKEERKNLVGTLIAGIAAGSGGNAADALMAGNTELENNSLTLSQLKAFRTAYSQCKTQSDCKRVEEKYQKVATKQLEEISALCAGNLDACRNKYGELMKQRPEIFAELGKMQSELDLPVSMMYTLGAMRMMEGDAMAALSSSTFAETVQKQWGVKPEQAALIVAAVTGGKKAVEAIVSGSLKGGGTVWDSIKATQPVYPGSVIPKSFEMSLPNGQKIWVHGNATEHMAEYAQMKAVNRTPEAVRLSSQQQLNSLQAAVDSATKGGVPYNKLINVDGWELRFSPGRSPNDLPALIHALPKL